MMNYKKLLCVFVFGCFCLVLGSSTQNDMFQTECHDRHFWIFVRSQFLRRNFRYEVRGDSGVQVVGGQWAGQCGYTLHLDSLGDLTLRVSYLACAVDNKDDSEFRLMLVFVNDGAADGQDVSHHPLLLSCNVEEPWHPREVICENNYMEVSVQKQFPPDHRGTEWLTPTPVDDALHEWRVLFRVPDLQHSPVSWSPLKQEIIPANLVHLHGYRISTTATRIVLRCNHGSRLAYRLKQDGDTVVEVVSTTIIYRQHWTLLRADTTVACSSSEGRLDGADVLWTLPWLLSPLVMPPVIQKHLKLAVGGHYVTQCVAHQRGYRIQDNNGIVEIRIPFGDEGGRLKGAVTNGVYSELFEVNVELHREWEDSAWKYTRHHSFTTMQVNQKPTLTITNHTDPSGKDLVVSVGRFLMDVVLVNVTVAEQVFSLQEAERSDVHISQVYFPNCTQSYLLLVPLTHPLITETYVGEGYRSYSISLVFSFLLSPDGETFHVPVTVHSILQDVVVPWLEGGCTEQGVQILVHYGNLQAEWSVFVGGRRLDWQLIEDGQYTLNTTDEFITINIPLYAPGMDYRGLDLHGLAVRVLVSLVHVEIMEEYTHEQECVFPVQELLVCLPDGQMVALLDVSSLHPSMDPKHLVLLESSCSPVDTDDSRALFRFPVESCGSDFTHSLGHIIYTNKVRYLPPEPAHLIPDPHLSYSVSLMCMYPETGPQSVYIYTPRSIAPSAALHTLPPHSIEIKPRLLPAGG